MGTTSVSASSSASSTPPEQRPAVGPEAPLTALRGIGPKRAAALAEAGVRRVVDLLFHLPLRYEDRRGVTRVAAVAAPGRYTFRGRLHGVRTVRLRRAKRLLLARLEDDSGSLEVVWFNAPYLAGALEEGSEVLAHGVVRRRGGGWSLAHPSLEAVGGGGLRPVYPALGGIAPGRVRGLVEAALAQVDPRRLPEPWPRQLLARRGLPSLGEALAALHAPPTTADCERLNGADTPWHHRLAYGELLAQQLDLARARRDARRVVKGHRYTVDDAVRSVARQVLPFPLTGAQKRALREIVEDLRSRRPMLRLLQGDVGSGKTIVAALALVVALESGLQAALMAPTELLAEQHYATLGRLLGERYRIALVSGSSVGALEPAVQLAVGTHALLEERARFRRLGLAVIDEQHRFGVAQRRLLEAKGERPDVLVMTATPIPRSLTLTLYGDLDVSLLDELPPGRRPVETTVVPARRRREVYRALRQRLEAGEQAYVVFPLIEASEAVPAEAVAALGEQLRGFLGALPSAVLHGRMPGREREAVMADFAAGRLRVLLATTVIEVGVDVPAATLMVIESAERFGLAQLHQLRGRVGRGGGASRCVALHGRLSDAARRRLAAFAATTDGFRLAEEDLALRGPGELLGTRQAGMPAFRLADPVRHRAWLEAARQDAEGLLEEIEAGRHAALRRRLAGRAAARGSHLRGG